MSTPRTLACRASRRFKNAVAPLNNISSTARASNIRFSSTTALAEEETSGNNHEPPKLFGEENKAKAIQFRYDLRKLKSELAGLYSRQRLLKQMLTGPYSVQSPTVPTLIEQPEIKVQDDKVTVSKLVLPNIWLRDNCQCGNCVHDATKQRLLDTFSIPRDIAIKQHSFEGDVLNIEWSDGHKSEYAREFLAQTAKPAGKRAVIRQGLQGLHLWDSSIAKNPPKLKFDAPADERLVHILKCLRNYGFCYVDAVPFDSPKATENLLRSISFIRETHYGGFYDFTADLASKDTAYTNIALEAHTDNTYFSDPAGLQAFHLLSHTDGEGGASLLVDGFSVAKELHETDRQAYEILSTVNVHAHASGNEGISIQPYRSFPVLEHDPVTGHLLRVRWNSADRASIELPVNEVEKWYDAARKFDALLKKKENEYWEQLTPGRVLIFDNWRVLHGRSKFTGKRRICGGYLNRDDWISKYKMMKFGKDRVLGALATS